MSDTSEEQDRQQVVVVTRQGWGDCWLFASCEEADEHPLVQYGDAIVDGPEGLLRQYNYLEVPRLARLLRVPGLAEEAEAAGAEGSERARRAALDRLAPRVWLRLVAVARQPPSQPSRICELVREDRRVSKEKAMADKKAAAATAEKTDTTKAAPAAKKEKTVPTDGAASGRGRARYAEGDKIYLLADAEGKKYGPKNNPKRAGTQAAADFEKYRDGITFKQLAEAIGSVSKAANDVAYNVARGYVEVRTAA